MNTWWWEIDIHGLLFTSEDRLCANLCVQEQSTNITSQCQYLTFAWRHRSTVVTSLATMAKSVIYNCFSGIVCLGHVRKHVRSKIIHLLPWITLLGSSRDSTISFTRDFVTRENYRQIASLATQKSLFTVTHALLHILWWNKLKKILR